MLFEVAILKKAKKDSKEPLETLIFGPSAFVAKDSQGAAIRAVMAAQATQTEPLDLDNLEVLARPFK